MNLTFGSWKVARLHGQMVLLVGAADQQHDKISLNRRACPMLPMGCDGDQAEAFTKPWTW